MNELVLNEDNIKSRIYTLRNMQVMLDKDLGDLYGVKAIRLREQVKRNIDRFSDDFMFQLNDDEVEFMVSQNAIPSRKHLGGSLPYVFTEQASKTSAKNGLRFRFWRWRVFKETFLLKQKPQMLVLG